MKNVWLSFLICIPKKVWKMYLNEWDYVLKKDLMCIKNPPQAYGKCTVCIEKSRHVLEKGIKLKENRWRNDDLWTDRIEETN